MKLRQAKPAQVIELDDAIEHLRIARECLKVADCPQTLKRVRAALKSAEGAQRHMHRRAQSQGWYRSTFHDYKP